ncbi:MAG: histidinol-phosphate aminotransferase family protein [Acidobacteriaceae bacterium]|jgi:histidinol-phosphate aminotransferase|nr:histidinol-phosphate aminotransferase family protein [Acidobacteriaceae bacterium]
MNKYQKPGELYAGLRLHQNENSSGCSPKVLDALATITREQMGFYPPYDAATRACADYLGVDPDHLSLVNGLDEGIMATAIGYLRPSADGFIPEAVIPEPAFEIFAFDTEVVGGTPVRVAPNRDFSFPLDRVLAAITPRTRVVFLTNPNNPTGTAMPLDAIRAVSHAVPDGAIVFVDEAYAEFSGTTFLPELATFRNVIVGRTFSKAFGLAGIRIGAIAGHPDTLEPLRLAIPVYSVNIAAVVAVQASLADLAYVESYVREVEQSKALLYAACDRLGLGYTPSAANFVLVHAGDRLAQVLHAVSKRGIYLRDRSTEPGCAGMFRVSAGVVAHTQQFIAALEEALCDAR